MKAFSIAVGLLVAAVSAVPVAAAQAQPSTVQRIIAQEEAHGRLAGQTEPTIGQRIATQERARQSEPRLVGPSGVGTTLVVEQPGGFDWGDAGVGAAAGLALTLLTAGGFLLVRDGRRHAAFGQRQS